MRRWVIRVFTLEFWDDRVWRSLQKNGEVDVTRDRATDTDSWIDLAIRLSMIDLYLKWKFEIWMNTFLKLNAELSNAILEAVTLTSLARPCAFAPGGSFLADEAICMGQSIVCEKQAMVYQSECLGHGTWTGMDPVAWPWVLLQLVNTLSPSLPLYIDNRVEGWPMTLTFLSFNFPLTQFWGLYYFEALRLWGLRFILLETISTII